jgi:hypothetical protein
MAELPVNTRPIDKPRDVMVSLPKIVRFLAYFLALKSRSKGHSTANTYG